MLTGQLAAKVLIDLIVNAVKATKHIVVLNDLIFFILSPLQGAIPWLPYQYDYCMIAPELTWKYVFQ